MYRIQKERRKMTDFAECSMAMQDFLMILLEICLILELILLLIRITCFYGKKKIITAVTVFAVSFMLMGFLMNDHRYCQGESAYQLMLRMCPVSVLMAAWWYCCFIFAGQSGERDADIIILCLTGL